MQFKLCGMNLQMAPLIDNLRFNRRDFLRMAAVAGLTPWQAVLAQQHLPDEILVNDVHSALNPTWVSAVLPITSAAAAARAIIIAEKAGQSLAICGSRHAAGGQQFLTDSVLLDCTGLNKILKLDRDAGLVTVECGTRWIDLQTALEKMQAGATKPWGINQKQTGLNTLTIGGTLAANAHGQGLLLKPFVGDIDSFKLIKADGKSINCSRQENADLFGLAIGGYGLL